MTCLTIAAGFSRTAGGQYQRRGGALSKKELSKARGYLERFATLPIAYNNMGILCLLEGNRDKAEVYLTMAATTGVEQAVKALGKLKIKK